MSSRKERGAQLVRGAAKGNKAAALASKESRSNSNKALKRKAAIKEKDSNFVADFSAGMILTCTVSYGLNVL